MGRVQRENLGKIIFPLKASETDIGYKIKIRLEAHGFICRQQVQAFCEFDGRIRKNFLDLVVFHRGDLHPIAVVEIKTGGRKPKPMRRTRQIQKYETFSTPLFWCRGTEMVEGVVQNILDLQDDEGPKGG